MPSLKLFNGETPTSSSGVPGGFKSELLSNRNAQSMETVLKPTGERNNRWEK